VAEQFGVDVQQVRHWTRESGCPYSKARGRGSPHRYDLAEVAAWRRSRGLGEKGKRGRPVRTGNEDIDKAKARKESAMADAWELKVHRLNGDMVMRTLVEEIGAEVIQVFTSRLQGVAASVVPRLVGREPHEQQALIHDSIRIVVDQLAEDLSTVGRKAQVAEDVEAE